MLSFLTTLVLDERLRRRRFYSALLLFAAILLLGSIPGARAEIAVFGPGIVLHSLAYGGLTLLLYTGTRGSRGRRALGAVLAVILMGALDEMLQSLLPYRSGTVRDWLVDCTAALFMAALLWRFLPAPAASR